MSACSSCHTIDGTPGAGPSLQGVLGRPVGGADGYSYSRGLAAKKAETWTEQKLIQYIDHPEAIAPGTTMPAPGLFHDEVVDVVAFLTR
jgi:cytochrome c